MPLIIWPGLIRAFLPPIPICPSGRQSRFASYFFDWLYILAVGLDQDKYWGWSKGGLMQDAQKDSVLLCVKECDLPWGKFHSQAT